MRQIEKVEADTEPEPDVYNKVLSELLHTLLKAVFLEKSQSLSF